MKETGGIRPTPASTTDELSRAELIVASAKLGWSVTPAQLERWQKHDLIARPRQIGLGRGAGTQSRYPTETVDQVVGVFEALRHRRSLLEIGLGLWLEGRSVPPAAPRRYLRAFARAHDRIVQIIRVMGFARVVVSDPALRLVGRMARRRAEGAVFGPIRSRLGGVDRVETVIRVLLQVATGAYDESFPPPQVGATDNEGLLVESAIGLGRARTDRLMGLEPWLSGDAHANLVDLAQLLRGSWLDTLESASDTDLAAARDAWLELRDLFVSFGDVIREHFGPYAFGFPAIADVLRAATPLQSAAFVLLLLRVQQGDDQELRLSVERLREAGRSWREIMPKLNALRVLRREVPAFAALLAPERIGNSMRDAASARALQEQLRAVAEAHRDEVLAVLARYPELGVLSTVGVLTEPADGRKGGG